MNILLKIIVSSILIVGIEQTICTISTVYNYNISFNLKINLITAIHHKCSITNIYTCSVN